MTSRMKFLFTALSTAMVLLIAVGSASALRSLSIEGETRLTLTGRVTFESNVANIICDTTFVKTISRVIPKVEGTLIGAVTDVRTANCASSAGTLRTVIILGVGVAELWRIFYKSFLGTLPNILGLLFQLRNVKTLFELRLLTVNSCLYEGNVGVLAAVRGGIIERLRTLDERAEQVEVPLITTLSGTCPSRGKFRASVTPTQNTRVILL